MHDTLAMPARSALSITLIAACAAACIAAWQPLARAAADPADAVVVTAVRDPVNKSYRKMIRGMDLFEQKHALAPHAALRFKLLPRKRGTNLEDIDVQIVGDSFETPVDVAADHTFTLSRDRTALREDASVRPNRKKQTMTWRADIRTPGLPPGTRRLGDLRLECQVGMAADLVSNVRSYFDWLAKLVETQSDYCNTPDNKYLFFADRPLFGVTLVSGPRRDTLPVSRLYAGASYDPHWKANLPYCDCEVLLDRSYFMPLSDRTWPDDTLVEFEYMDDGNASQAASTPR